MRDSRLDEIGVKLLMLMQDDRRSPNTTWPRPSACPRQPRGDAHPPIPRGLMAPPARPLNRGVRGPFLRLEAWQHVYPQSRCEQSPPDARPG